MFTFLLLCFALALNHIKSKVKTKDRERYTTIQSETALKNRGLDATAYQAPFSF
jgi:hypothetical protein